MRVTANQVLLACLLAGGGGIALVDRQPEAGLIALTVATLVFIAVRVLEEGSDGK